MTPTGGSSDESGGGPPGVLLVFLDGVGIGEPDPARNPFFAARLPTLERLTGGLPSLDHLRPASAATGRPVAAVPIDATLGVDGTPQSGTGQASLLTGLNAAREFGRHFGPWIPTGLRDEVRDRNLLVRALELGHRAAFANAYPPGWPGERARRRVAGPPLAALGAGLLTRHAEHLARGDAVSSEIENDGWIQHLGPPDLPRPTPTDAGRTLGRIAARGGLTMYAHYATDTAGHRGELGAGVHALERVDAFLGGVLDTLPARHRVVVVSDHGNIEDVHAGHTRHPALGLIVGASGESDGKAARAAASLTSLVHVPGVVLELLG